MKTQLLVKTSLLASISFVLSLLVLFQLPNGGSISLYLIPLLITSFLLPLRYGLLCGFVVATLQIIFGGFIINPIQLILDYYLPIIFLSSIKLIPWFNPYLKLLVCSSIALLSYVISGMIFFNVPFSASLVYNATFFIPTLIINFTLFMLLKAKFITDK
ncbi:MAG: energy-coupled thiamine transporter ThiT [Bacilli bacterium]